MELLHYLYVMVFIGQVFRKCFSLFANVSNSNNKKPGEFYKKTGNTKTAKRKRISAKRNLNAPSENQ